MIKSSQLTRILPTDALVKELKTRHLGVFPLNLPFEYKPRKKVLTPLPTSDTLDT